MQHSTSPYDDLARVPRTRPRQGSRRRTTASRHRRRSPARCSCRVVSPVHDARFIDLILADHRACSPATLASAPGTGLERPETGRQNRRYRDLDRRQRPNVPHLNPRKCPQSAGYSSETGKRRFASDCVVVPRGFEPPTKPLYPDVSGAYASHRLPIIARYFLECRTIGIGLRHIRRLRFLSGVDFVE